MDAYVDGFRMTVYTDEMGGVRITGVFGADVTGLLPMSWAVAKAGARGYDVGLNTRLPTPHTGTLSVRDVPFGRRNIHGDAGRRWR